MTKTIMAILAALSVGIIATVGTAPAFAELSLPFQGSFEGYDTDGDDYSGSFVDFGLFSVFEGIVETKGVYEFIEDPSHQEGGYYVPPHTQSLTNQETACHSTTLRYPS